MKNIFNEKFRCFIRDILDVKSTFESDIDLFHISNESKLLLKRICKKDIYENTDNFDDFSEEELEKLYNDFIMEVRYGNVDLCSFQKMYDIINKDCNDIWNEIQMSK